MIGGPGVATEEPPRTPPSSTESCDLLAKHSLEQSSESPDRPAKIARTEPEDPTDGGDEVEGKQGEDQATSGIVKEVISSNPRMQRYLVAVEYVGTGFSGSQKQPNRRTVVGVLEAAFQKFIGQPVSVVCSSRTDTGVHALSNVCHVDVERISKRKPGEVLPPHEPSVVKRAVNHFLQKDEGDIMVVDVRLVPSDFHARYRAQERTYHYRLLSGSDPLSTFEKDRAWHVAQDMNLHAMQEACKVLVGHHDFSSFRAAGCQANSPVRTLDELHVCEAVSAPSFPSEMERNQTKLSTTILSSCSNKLLSSSFPSNDDEHSNSNLSSFGFGMRKGHHCFVVTARAQSFLYHQVRLLVGVLKCVGAGDITISDGRLMSSRCFLHAL
ncbi:hypothetical protein Dimus_013714 [Dionaea muscipula]